ncbi:MAG: TerB family tellurite resistance protein [Gammaproteobacteria bacterium]
MEPDPRFGGASLKASEPVALFRLGDATVKEPTDAFRAATLLLQLASAVAAADGTVSPDEQRHLEAHLEQSLHLDAAERQRLDAHLVWQLQTPMSMAGLAKRIEPLDATQRQVLGEFLIGMAGADGVIDAGEVRTLEKIYQQLNLQPQALYYAAIHQYGAQPAAAPVTVREGSPGPTGVPIPQPAVPGAAPELAVATGFTLDPQLIARKLEDTRAVHSILSSVFEAEEEGLSTNPAPGPQTVPLVAGLDAAHSALFHRIATQTELSGATFEAACAELGLLAGGAHHRTLARGDHP